MTAGTTLQVETARNVSHSTWINPGVEPRRGTHMNANVSTNSSFGFGETCSEFALAVQLAQECATKYFWLASKCLRCARGLKLNSGGIKFAICWCRVM